MRVHFTFFLISSVATISLARIIRSTEEKTPDFIMPVSHIKVINGEFVTFRDKELGEPSSQERACIPRDQATDEGLQTMKKQGNLQAEMEGEDQGGVEATTHIFNDTTPFNGTEVEDVMHLQVFKPLCDD